MGVPYRRQATGQGTNHITLQTYQSKSNKGALGTKTAVQKRHCYDGGSQDGWTSDLQSPKSTTTMGSKNHSQVPTLQEEHETLKFMTSGSMSKMPPTGRRQEPHHTMLSHNGTTDVGQNHRGTGSMVNDERDCTNHSQQNPRGTKKMVECRYIRSTTRPRKQRWNKNY